MTTLPRTIPIGKHVWVESVLMPTHSMPKWMEVHQVRRFVTQRFNSGTPYIVHYRSHQYVVVWQRGVPTYDLAPVPVTTNIFAVLKYREMMT